MRQQRFLGTGSMLLGLVALGAGASIPPPPSSPPPPPLTPDDIWERDALAWAHKVLEGAEKEHDASNGTSMLSSLLHLTAPLRPMTSLARRQLQRMAQTPTDASDVNDANGANGTNGTQHGRRAFRVHDKEWCYACKCQICPKYATSVFVRGKVGSDPMGPSPPAPMLQSKGGDFKPEMTCPPIVPNPAIYLAWAQTIAPIPLLPFGFSYVKKWQAQGWVNPIYLPRQCMIDQDWQPLFLMSRLLMAAAAFAMDECTTKCWKDYGCWKCGGEYGMWVDGYPWKKSEYDMMDVPANSYYWSRSFGAIDNAPYRLGKGATKDVQEQWSKQTRTERGCTGDCENTAIAPTDYANVLPLTANAVLVMDPMALIPTRRKLNGTAPAASSAGAAATPGA